jgi:class 3 adenylate cyclase/tetratricopeptide (TPR) repeat protein
MNECEQLEQAIVALEAQRALLGDAVVDAAIAPMREKLATLSARQPGVEQQRKQITVLFADVSGFTAMSETMDPEEVCALMNALWTRLDTAITTQGGCIDKHIGDAVMALFGAPIAREDDPERAIRAALAMQKEIRDLGAEREAGGPSASRPSLSMRIGINTGMALLGEVGTTAEYTAMGDTVNLASRLEHAAPVGGILVSHATYRHVRGLFNVQSLEPIQVKGKAEPIQVYLVQSAKPRAFRVPTRGVEGVETRTIGREAELGRLQAAMTAARADRKAHLVTVVGEAGVGKSRLLYEFMNWLELQPEPPLLFQGRATQDMINLPYSLMRDVLAFGFEIQESDPAAVVREKLERGMVDFLGAGGLEKVHFIGHLIGFDFSNSPYLHGILGDARQIRDRAFHYVAQLLAEVTRHTAAAILLEDIHWADQSSLDLIDYVLKAQPDLPLLVMGLTRPVLFERRPGWGEGNPFHIRLGLRPLSKRDARRLVEEILQKVGQVPEALRELVVGGAEGNPYYVEELIKMLIEDGVILKGEERWCIEPTRLTTVRVPPTLTGVLQARLDSLPREERTTLQRAAMVGRVFWNSAVQSLCCVAEDEAQPQAMVDERLHILNGKELVFPREKSAFVGAVEHIFKHAILHDVTYESVLKSQRRAYHACVAAWLIERTGERVGEFAGRIGWHYERAGELAEAGEWYARAGKQAQDTYALETAIEYYQKALEFLPATGGDALVRRIEMYEGLARSLQLQARYTESEEAYVAMEGAAQAAGETAAQARAWLGLWNIKDALGDHPASLEVTRRAEEIARSAGEPGQRVLAAALRRQGWTHYFMGDTEAASALGGQALALSQKLDDQSLMAESFSLMGAIAYDFRRDAGQAARHFESALAISRKLGDRRLEGDLLNNLGIVTLGCGDHRAAAGLFQGALAVAREIGYRDLEMLNLTNLGGARVALGDHCAAEADLRQAIHMAVTSGSRGILPEAYRYLAEALLGQGETEAALMVAHLALAAGQENNEPFQIGAAWRALGMAAARLPEPVAIEDRAYDAAACYAESLRIFTEKGIERERAWTLRAWAEYEMARNLSRKEVNSSHRDTGALETTTFILRSNAERSKQKRGEPCIVYVF